MTTSEPDEFQRLLEQTSLFGGEVQAAYDAERALDPVAFDAKIAAMLAALRQVGGVLEGPYGTGRGPARPVRRPS